MTDWSYDDAIDAAYIQIDLREPARVRTVDLSGIHVLLDVDADTGKVLGIELLGTTHRYTILRDLGKVLKSEANQGDL